jgi:hypothetical protein
MLLSLASSLAPLVQAINGIGQACMGLDLDHQDLTDTPGQARLLS